ITLSGCNGTFPAADPNLVTDEADNCSTPTVTFVSEGTPSLSGCLEPRVRTYRVTDACGNSISVTQQLTRTVDITKPTISGQATVTGSCNVVPAFVDPTVTEGCSTASLVTGYPIDGVVTDAPNCKKTQTRTWKYVDACGNVSDEFVQTKTWTVDVTKPSVSGQATITGTICNVVPAFVDPIATEGCSTASLVTGYPIDGVVTDAPNCKKTQTRTWKYVDACGNVSDEFVQTKNWTVDNTPPTITPSANVTIDCTATPSFTLPTASDACSAATVNQVGSDVTGGNSCVRTITRTWNAVDACGKTSGTVAQTITLADMTPPTMGSAGGNTTI